MAVETLETEKKRERYREKNKTFTVPQKPIQSVHLKISLHTTKPAYPQIKQTQTHN